MPHKFLIATMPVPGHVAPFAPLVRALLRNGHEVLWYGSRHYQKSIEATGARYAPMVAGRDIGDAQYDRHFPERKQFHGLRQVVYDFEKVFVESAPGMVEDLQRLLRDFPADVLLADPAVAAARIISERGGPPCAVLNITVLSFETPEMAAFGLGLQFDNSILGRWRNRLTYKIVDHVVFRSVNRTFRKLARQHNWPIRPFRPSLSDSLHLQPMVPQFEFPLRAIPSQVHFIGALLPESSTAFIMPSWWKKVVESGKPVILVTQGTIATNPDELIRPTLEAMAKEDVWVIATTGGKTAEQLDFAIPDNALVAPFIPFVPLMPHVAVYVTNGGYGGICIALAHGVPVVSAGTTEDKMEVGNRVAHAGVGFNLRTNRPSVERLHAAITKTLRDPTYATRARAIKEELEKHSAADEATKLLEKLAATGKPVYRV